MKSTTSSIFVLVAVILYSTTSFGAAIVDQHPAVTNAANALFSNLFGPEFQQQIADDFTLDSGATIESVEWSGYFFDDSVSGSASTVDFIVRFFADGLRTAPFFSENVSATFTQTGTTDGLNDPIYRFSAPLSSPLHLLGSSTYWFSVLDSDPATTVDFAWLESENDFNSIRSSRAAEGMAWVGPFMSSGDQAFSLLGTVVPEPSSVLLMSITMSALAFREWHRQSAGDGVATE